MAALSTVPGPDGTAALDLRSTGPAPIARTKLIERLSALPGASVAVVVAPVGYGKSALLSQWAARDPRPFASACLTAGEDSALPMLAAVARALRSIPALRTALEPDGIPRGKRAAGELAARIQTVLAATDEPFVLTIDDLHVIRSADAVATLATLIDHIGPHVRIALASREHVPLRFARLRAEQRLMEIRTADLVLTRTEVERLASAHGLDLDETGLDLLAARTEGWPAAVYLAALATRSEPVPERGVAAFGGDERTIAAYVREEILAGLPPRTMEFLARSSILGRLSGPVCDYVLEREGSGGLLTRLSRTNVLLVPLDRTDRDYRYHPLFAQALQHELALHEPDLPAILHSRASSWYETQDQLDLAIDHAAAAGDIDRAGALLWRQAPTLVAYGRSARLAHRLTAFSTAQIASSAPLAMAAAAADLAFGNRALVERWTTAAAEALETTAATARDASLDGAMAAIGALVADSDLAAMRANAESVQASSARDSVWGALACLVDGAATHLAGDPAAARMKLEEGARRGAALAPAVQVLCLSQLALVAIDDQEWDAAQALAARARTQSERSSVADYPLSALVFAVSAAVEAHYGHVESCDRDTRRADRLLAELAGFAPWYTAECRIALASAALRMGALPRARRLLAEAEYELRLLPDATAAHDWISSSKAQAESIASQQTTETESLTVAELRVLQFLPTHLSFPEIGSELYVSTNTVKTHARALYRKLGARSRSEAVAQARSSLLLDEAA